MVKKNNKTELLSLDTLPEQDKNQNLFQKNLSRRNLLKKN